MSFQFHDMLDREITKAMNDAANDLAVGCASDFSDYRFRCGIVAGLRRAVNLAEEVKQKMLGNG